jgi:hypothetical protein
MIESTGTRPASLPSSGTPQRWAASDNVHSNRRQVATASPLRAALSLGKSTNPHSKDESDG